MDVQALVAALSLRQKLLHFLALVLQLLGVALLAVAVHRLAAFLRTSVVLAFVVERQGACGFYGKQFCGGHNTI